MSQAKKAPRHQAASKADPKTASSGTFRHAAKPDSLLAKQLGRLKNAQRICLYAFIGCLAAAAVVFSILFLPDLLASEESLARKSADSFLESLQNDDTESAESVDLSGFPIGSVLLSVSEDSQMPESFSQAYGQAVIHSWKFEDLNREQDEIVMKLTLTTLDPDTFSVSMLREDLQDVLNQSAEDFSDESDEEDSEALRQALADQAYDYLNARLEEAEYHDVPVIITASSDGRTILSVRQEN